MLKGKYKKWVLWALAAIAVAVIVRLIRDAIQRKQEAAAPDVALPETSSTSGGGAPAIDATKTLQMGSRGAEVKELQRRLNLARGGNLPIAEDGIFGVKTLDLLQKVTGKSSIRLADFPPPVDRSGNWWENISGW